MKKYIFLFLLQITFNFVHAAESDALLEKGWSELLKDNDSTALNYFEQAYQKANQEKRKENSAVALLNMGICSYGVSYSVGLNYCLRAMDAYKELEKSDKEKALIGRSKCLVLISTIKARQGKFKEAIALSLEAKKGFPSSKDTSGYLGLVYYGLGNSYMNLSQMDSAEYYHRLALQERLQTKKYIYIPASYLSVADIELQLNKKELSLSYYQLSYAIADSTGNRQSQVAALFGLGKWLLKFDKNAGAAEQKFIEAKQIANKLSDRSFYLKCLEQLYQLKKAQNNYPEALSYAEELKALKDSLSNWERERVTKSLETQFDVAEKDRRLSLLQKEKDIVLLTNTLLWLSIGFILILALGIILFLRKLTKRDALLLQAKEEKMQLIEAQKILKEQQLHNELEFKESQLSALTLQMLQKNELMLELQQKLEADASLNKDNAVSKLINKGLNHDKEWSDFNTHFESVNKNFYNRLKQVYSDISPNDLKICALIKLNLSTKEMAGILNISPDSVKTARYRLRKKLQLNTEDNLTEFILNLK